MIFVEKRGDAVAVSAGGDPPALLTSTSRRPKRSITAVTSASTCVRLSHVGCHEHGVAPPDEGSVVGLGPAADDDVGARVEEPSPRCRGRRRAHRR